MTKASPGNCPQQSESINRQGRREREKLFSLAVNSNLGLQCHKKKKKKKGCQRPSSVYMLSHAEIASLGQPLGGEISRRAGTAAVPAQGHAGATATEALRRVFPLPDRDWESALHCSRLFRGCFTRLPHFHKAPWPPSSPHWFDEYSSAWLRIRYSPCPNLSVLY